MSLTYIDENLCIDLDDILCINKYASPNHDGYNAFILLKSGKEFHIFENTYNALSDAIKNKGKITETYKDFRLYLDIEECEFTVRTYNTLKSAGINTIGDLLEHSSNELIRLPNCGRKSLMEIEEFLIYRCWPKLFLRHEDK